MAFLEPAAQTDIIEETLVTGHDRLRRARDRGGDDWSVIGIAHLDCHFNVREKWREHYEDIRYVSLADPIAPEPWASQNVDDLLGQVPGRDGLDATVAHHLEDPSGNARGMD
jgi:hypothetical protein